MKKVIIYTLLMFGCLSILTSCEDWFDVSPKVEIKEDDLFKDEDGYFDALVGVYSIMASENLYGKNMTMGFMDALVQNYYITSAAHPFYYASKYDYTHNASQTIIDKFWEKMYEAVVNTNNVLTRLEKASKSMFSDDNYNLIKGEALALRAYLHFDLLRMFGPSFKMDKDRKCIPYVKTVSKENTPYSSPVEVVNACVADLEKALTCLVNDPVKNSVQETDNIYLMNRKTRLNVYAVQGLLARVYMYGDNKGKALEYALKLVDNDSLPLTTNISGVRNDRVFSQELLFGLFVDKISTWADDFFKSSSMGYDLQQLEYYLDLMYDKTAGLGNDVRYSELFDIADYYGKQKKYLQLSTDNYNAKYRVPMLRLSEIYYIAAECTTDLGEAARWLNLVRKARNLEEKKFNSFSEVQAYLTAEYRREFYSEGQLFYRYKWLNASAIDYCTINSADKLEQVYILPLPDQEKEFGGVANGDN